MSERARQCTEPARDPPPTRPRGLYAITGRRAWVVWGAFLAMVVVSGVSYALVAFFDALVDEFGATRAEVGLAFGVFGLVSFASSSIAGILADRYGPRRICAIGVAWTTACLVTTGQAESLRDVYLAYGAGAGVGVALVFTPAIACVQPWFARRRGLATGIASTGISVGTFGAPLLSVWLIKSYHWRDAFCLLALGVIVIGLVGAALLKHASRTWAGDESPNAGLSLGQALRSRRF